MENELSAQQRARLAQMLLAGGEARPMPPTIGQRVAGMASGAIDKLFPPGNPYAAGLRDLGLGTVPSSLDMIAQGEPGVMSDPVRAIDFASLLPGGGAAAKGLGALGALPLGAIIKDMPAPKWRKGQPPVPVGVNPTPEELAELFDETADLQKDWRGVLRALEGRNGEVYTWPVNQALHEDVAKHFDLPYNPSKAHWGGGPLLFAEDALPNWKPRPSR